MKRLLFVFILLAVVSSAVAQVRYFDERYVSTLSFLNPVLINPGATGNAGTHQVIVNYKNKWATFPGTPKSYLVSYDGPVADRLGFGVLASSDTNGSLETTKLQGSLSYTIESPKNVIGAGFSAEYINHNLAGDVLTHRYVDAGDAIILDRSAGNGFFDVSVGAQGLYDKTISYGISLPSLVSSSIGNSDDTFTREIGFIANVGYIYSSGDATFEPSVFVKQLNNVPFHADINLLGRFIDDKLRGGITYTVGGDKRLGFLVGATFNAMGLNYSYNASRHDFQTYNNGSHEFSLRFDIGGGKKKVDAEGMEMMPETKTERVLEGINN